MSTTHRRVTIDGNEAAVRIAYQLSEVIAIFPITPSTPMGEQADAWAATQRPNFWGTVPTVIEMQSEGGAAGALHGALQSGSLATTFTASQGLLLMVPNMYKIAGELTPVVFHVAARAVAAQALSIFGDHSDVMATRATGFGILASSSVQEAHDLALIAHAATLRARVPFVHMLDGFRTSHELNTIEAIDETVIRAMIDEELVTAHRRRALSPEHPFIRGTAQNPDLYFQARESVNPFYLACPAIVQDEMDRFAALTGRAYHLFDYTGAADAERVIILIGSGAETARETARRLVEQGERVGVITVHLYRPFSAAHLLPLLPASVRAIAVLDRTKEPGSAGEPLYLDVMASIYQGLADGSASFRAPPQLCGGRYGLASKEFTPAMVKAIFDHLTEPRPASPFTVGIDDDVTHLSLKYDSAEPGLQLDDPATVRCVFFGLGADGTVGANKNAITIIGEETDGYAQGYFVYDSKKSGSVTISHLRFGPRPIQAPYLVDRADFVACHQFRLLEQLEPLTLLQPGGVFLLNCPHGPETIWSHLPASARQALLDKQPRFFVIDAQQVAQAIGLGGRINTIMQTCFFAISGVLPREEAIAQIKAGIRKSYGRRGESVVERNFRAVDQTLAHLQEIVVPVGLAADRLPPPPVAVPLFATVTPDFVSQVIGPQLVGRGDHIPVSALPVDGTYPSATARWEKRNLASEIPVWESDLCIQCGKCVFVCPHAAIRHNVYPEGALSGAPATFVSTAARFREFPDWRYTLQVAAEDCTGCGLCIEACPVKDKRQVGRKAINLAPQAPLRDGERANWSFFLNLPEVDRGQLNLATIKHTQLLEPLFEFSGACAGCGETPYLKLLSQLFGDRAMIANATGCSSIYGGNLPTTPWSINRDGRGPAWSNSLFEDNAEFGLGMRLAIDQQLETARRLLQEWRPIVGPELIDELNMADQSSEAGLARQRERVASLKQRLTAWLEGDGRSAATALVDRARRLLEMADVLVRRSIWLVGGDGWAYDIGFGGLDHVLAAGRNINVLVLDTEVYSNTGGQASKATPRAAVAKFAARGKGQPKKDLGLLAMAYGHIYVAQIAMGADDTQTLQAFREAEMYDGPSLIIAYSHCIAHGIDMRSGLGQQKLAVQTGYWPLFRFNPARAELGQAPLVIDSPAPTLPLDRFTAGEARFRILGQSDPARAEELSEAAQGDVKTRWQLYQQLAAMATNGATAPVDRVAAATPTAGNGSPAPADSRPDPSHPAS